MRENTFSDPRAHTLRRGGAPWGPHAPAREAVSFATVRVVIRMIVVSMEAAPGFSGATLGQSPGATVLPRPVALPGTGSAVAHEPTHGRS